MSLEVKEYLNKLGLTSIETDLYLAIISLGQSTVLDLSRYTEIGRSTVHVNVEKLINKGLLKESKSGHRRVIIAENPDKIKSILDRETVKIEQLKNSSNRMIRLLKNTSNTDTSTNHEFSYYKGRQSIQNIYKDTLKASYVVSFANLDKYYKLYPGTRKLFVNALNVNKDRIIKTIAVDSYLSRQIEKTKSSDRYLSKFISKEFFDNVDIHIYDNKIAIITLDPKSPSAVVIDSEIVALAFKGIHNVLWNTL